VHRALAVADPKEMAAQVQALAALVKFLDLVAIHWAAQVHTILVTALLLLHLLDLLPVQ
jgi:hypothetical protein